MFLTAKGYKIRLNLKRLAVRTAKVQPWCADNLDGEQWRAIKSLEYGVEDTHTPKTRHGHNTKYENEEKFN